MKLNKLWAAAALTLALVSCKNEPAKEPEQQAMKFPVSLSIEGNKGALRAEQIGSTSPAASYANERAVENLTVVVFTTDNATNTPIAVEKVISYDELTKPAGNDPYQGNYQFDMEMAGTFQLEVIANGYKDDTDKAVFIGKFPVGMSYDEFKKVVFDRALPNHGENGFAMLSTEPVKVTTAANTTTNAGTIRLRRLACRFDVFNKLVDELKLTKVTLQNQTVKSYMMTQTAVPTGADGGAKEYIQTANGTWFTPTVVSGGIYSYENPTKGAVKLQLEGTYNNQAWQKTIELLDKNGSPVATQRNHIYRILLTKGNGSTPGGGDEKDKDKITYNIEVLDWDEDASFDYTDGDVMDAEQGKKVGPTKVINPLQYVAEYNMKKTSTGDFFQNKTSSYGEMCYSLSEAKTKFSSFEVDGVKYHLPSIEEWLAIVPTEGVRFDKASDKLDYSEDVMVAGEKISCLQDVKSNGNGVVYALRFKGTKYLSAWKYDINAHGEVTITSRPVANGVTCDDIANESFWDKNKASDIVRIFRISGYKVSERGVHFAPKDQRGGAFWSTTEKSSGISFMFFIDDGVYPSESKFYCLLNVRPFRDTF